MKTAQDQLAAAGASVVEVWVAQFDEAFARIAGRFGGWSRGGERVRTATGTDAEAISDIDQRLHNEPGLPY